MAHKKPAKKQAGSLKTRRTSKLLAAVKKRGVYTPLLFLVVVFAAILLCVPSVHQKVTAHIVKKSVRLIIEQAGTEERVSLADVVVGGTIYQSDQTGEVQVKGLASDALHIVVAKPFYADYSETVHVAAFKKTAEIHIKLRPLGTVTKVTVKNSLNDHPLGGVRITTDAGAKGITGYDGIAELMLPHGLKTTRARLDSAQILPANVTLWAANNAQTNELHVIPKGNIYYLTSRDGLVSVVKSNLDGSAAKIVAPSVGREGSVQMIAAKDWQNLAVTSASGGVTKLKLLRTSDDSWEDLDTASDIIITGWQDDWLVYRTVQSGAPVWQQNHAVLKAYNATSHATTVLESTRGEGNSVLDYVAMDLPDVFLADGHILYTTHWSASYYYGSRFTGKNMQLISVKPDGSGKAELHSWPAGYDTVVQARPNGSNELYVHIELDGVQHSYWRYKNGAVTQDDALGDVFLNGAYHYFLDSPNAAYTLWAEPVNTQNMLYVGDRQANNRIKLAERTAFVPYGWYTNDYVLLYGGAHELRIVGREGVKPGLVPLKVATIYPPNNDVHSYGEGYQR